MAVLPIDEAISRFKDNESRVDGFVNGEGYTTTGGEAVESIPPFMRRIETEVLSLATIGAKPFQTLVQLQASPAPAPGVQSWAVVTNDSVENNGFYFWNGAQWAKSTLQPATASDVETLKILEANTSANASAAKSLALNSGSIVVEGQDLIAFCDKDGYVIGFFSKDAQLHLVGAKQTVQEFMQAQNAIINAVVSEDGLFSFCDKDGYIIAKMLPDGDIQSAKFGLLSEALENANSPPHSDFGSLRVPSDSLTQATLTALSCSDGFGVPAPFGVLPTIRNFGSAWLGNVTTTENEPIDIRTPYDPNNGVVHPYLLEFYNGWNGWRYVLGLTGYTNTNENQENPFICASNDLLNWTLITPILAERPAVPSGHNSDIALVYEPRTKELICLWRQSIRLDGPGSPSNRVEDSIWIRKTRDGKTWTDAELSFGPYPRTVEIATSPTVVFDPVNYVFHMYMGGAVGNRYALRHFKSSSITGPWEKVNDIVMPSGIQLWHCEVKFVGNRLVALIQDNTTNAKNLFFGISEVGSFDSFTFNESPVINSFTYGMYKASFLPEFDENTGTVAFQIAWTGDNTPSIVADRWKLFINRTNFTVQN